MSGMTTASIASYATIAAAVASTAVAAGSAIQQSNAASASAKYNSQVQENNARMAKQNAEYTAAQGEQNVAALGAENRAKIADTLTNEGAGGVDVNSGSFVGIRQSEAKLGMLNALNARSQAVRQSYGYQTEASSNMDKASLSRSEGKNAIKAGRVEAGGAILSGASNMARYSDILMKDDPIKMTGSDAEYSMAQDVIMGT